jgi:hypothetical protein
MPVKLNSFTHLRALLVLYGSNIFNFIVWIYIVIRIGGCSSSINQVPAEVGRTATWSLCATSQTLVGSCDLCWVRGRHLANFDFLSGGSWGLASDGTVQGTFSKFLEASVRHVAIWFPAICHMLSVDLFVPLMKPIPHDRCKKWHV